MTEVLTLYSNMTEDDGEFKPSESTISNLTSLFDSNKPHPNENHSLTYVAPKAPKVGESCGILKQSGSKGSNQKLKIITSKNVQVYKLEKGNYVNQGTAGIAIVGNCGLHLYQVILYKNNKDHLCKTHITPSFSLTVLENNYTSFYDNSGQNWSILFSSSCNVEEFAKQVAIAKYNSQNNQERIIIQDLSPFGEAKGKEKDILKVAYTCSVLENDEVVPWKEKETVTVELIDVNAFPWHEGIRDWSEHSKRIIVIPYRLSAPWTNDLNKNTCLVMELELVCIISSCSVKSLMQKEKEKEKSDEGGRSTKTKGGGVIENSGEEGHCKGKTASLKDSIFFSRSHKTDIISRIAKMGQGFPVGGTVASGPSDSEDECPSTLRSGMNVKSVKNLVQQLHRSVPIHLGRCSVEAENSHWDNLDDEIHRNKEITGSREQKKMRSNTNVVIEEWEPCRNLQEKESERNWCSETSFVDEELRTSIHKLSEKVDEVLKKLQNRDCSKWDRFEERESGEVIDPISVLTSIPGFIVEHKNLKTEMERQRLVIDEQNKKIVTLTDLTQRCVEKCSAIEGKGTVENKIMSSGKQMGKAKEWSKARKNESPCDAERYYREDSSENQSTRYSDDLTEKLGEDESGVRDSQRKLDRAVADKECQVSWNGGGKNEIINVKTEDTGETCSSSKVPESISCEDTFQDIKRVMNAVNKKLQGYFEPGMNYSGSEVKEIIASTIKDVTVEYLKHKSKLRCSSGTEFSVIDKSERRFEELREQIIGEGQQESGLSHVRGTFDSAGYSGQRNSPDKKNVNSSRLPVNTKEKDTESRLSIEKSGSHACEMVSSRSIVSPVPSELSRFSKITGVARDDSYRRDASEDRRKSASDSAKNYSKNSLSSRKTLTDAGEESAIGSSSRRLDNIGVTCSENQSISQQETSVRSKLFIECRRDDNVEDENCDITISKKEVDTKSVIISRSTSQRSVSIAEEQALEPGKITRNDSSRLGENEKVEVDEGVVDIAESAKSVVSELTRGVSVKTIAQPSTVTATNEESILGEGMEGNVFNTRRKMRAKSEIIGRLGGEAKKPEKNLDEISEKINEAGSRELLSLQSMSRVRSEGLRVDNTFGEHNVGVNVRRTPDVEEVKNEEIEILDESSTRRESDDKKSTVLAQPPSDISTWKTRDEYSSTEENIRDAKISGVFEKDSACAADIATNVVESKRQIRENNNESVRSETLKSENAKTLAVEEDSYESETEKAGSLSETVISDATEPDGGTGELSTVSGLVRNVTEGSAAGSSLRTMGNDGVTSSYNTSNLREAVSIRPFSARSVVPGKESVMGVESLGGEDGEIRREGDDDEGSKENEGSEENEWEECGRIGSIEEEAKDNENEKDETERDSLGDPDEESLAGQENVKSSGANSVNGACNFPDYYQNWILSKPPPLPLEEDDDEDDDCINTIDNDEEWL